MEEQVCKQCGKPFIPSNASKLQACCSKSCAAKWRWTSPEASEYDPDLEWKYEDFKWVCPYHVNVACRTRRCNSCGWNPVVEKIRNAKLGVTV